MQDNTIEDGWQRFLEKLRRLWGKLRSSELPKTAVNAAVDAWEDDGGATTRPTEAKADPAF